MEESPNDITGSLMTSSLGMTFNIYIFSIDLEVYTCTQKCQNDDFWCSDTLDTWMGQSVPKI